jgi:hypothetical protein
MDGARYTIEEPPEAQFAVAELDRILGAAGAQRHPNGAKIVPRPGAIPGASQVPRQHQAAALADELAI